MMNCGKAISIPVFIETDIYIYMHIYTHNTKSKAAIPNASNTKRFTKALSLGAWVSGFLVLECFPWCKGHQVNWMKQWGNVGSHRIRPQYQRSFQACKWVWCNLIWTVLSVPLVLSSTVYFSTPPQTPAQIVVPFTTLNSHLLLLATPNSHLHISQLVFLIILFLAEVRTAPASPPTMLGAGTE